MVIYSEDLVYNILVRSTKITISIKITNINPTFLKWNVPEFKKKNQWISDVILSV